MQPQNPPSSGPTSPDAQSGGPFDIDVMAALLDQLAGYADGFVRSLPKIVLAVLIVLAFWGASKALRGIIRRTLEPTKIRRALIEVSQTLVGVVFWVLGILIAMSVLFPSVKPSSVLTALGVGGVAIGFAFKDIFENFLAGIMIMLRKPMRIGDFIECQGFEGRIEEIMFRDSYVRQLDGQLVLVPNALLYKNPVYVRTDLELRRYEIVAGVAYDADVAEAREVIRDAVEGCEQVSKQKPVEVWARELNRSSIDFTVRWWAPSRQPDMHSSRDEVVEAVRRALNEAGIEIPFPQRTLTFGAPLETKRVDMKARKGDEDDG